MATPRMTSVAAFRTRARVAPMRRRLTTCVDRQTGFRDLRRESGVRRDAKSPRHALCAGAFLLRCGLFRPFEDLDETPALSGRQRTGFHQGNPIADTGVTVLVVRLDLRGGADDLAVERVALTIFQLDHDGLLHLVADHVADTRLTTPTRLLGARSVFGA